MEFGHVGSCISSPKLNSKGNGKNLWTTPKLTHIGRVKQSHIMVFGPSTSAKDS
ncbi:hypothetical protein COCNU_01G021360 [Cocos nucifera]|uniref:Uncharacterized protein n=1 Tax=Cocos nucifera TaxID=13894 RepID=A0A8K0HX08_COCNU|nr:hypothetical protein COCNU_01G021360 [Cocos nucifera]